MNKIILSAFLISIVPCYSALANGSSSNGSSKSDQAGEAGEQYRVSDQQFKKEEKAEKAGKKADQAGQQGEQQAGAADETAGTSTASSEDVTRGAFQREIVGITPSVGMINYRDSLGNVGNRGMVGLLLDMNASNLVSNLIGMGGSGLYVGPQVGAFYSHVGPGNADFLGQTPDSGGVGAAGTNMAMFPLNLKAGWTFGNFRPAIHGGGNLIYRSSGQSLALGANPDTSAGSVWSLQPNVGVDLQYGLGPVAVNLRPDLTFGGSNLLWSAILGATIPIG